MAFKDGDFVKIEYSAWRMADDSLVYTTDEKKAQEAGIFDKETRYGPQLIVIGKGMIIKSLEDAIRGMGLNETKKLELEPKDAFGERSQELVRVMSIADFRKKEIEPYPGLRIDIDGVSATVKSVNSGRVLVDANHPLAGERVRYEIKIVSQVSSKEDKVKDFAEMYRLIPTKVEIDGSTATLVFGNEIKKDANFLVNKSQVVSSILAYMEDVDKVIAKEEYEREKGKIEEEKKDEKSESKQSEESKE